MRVSRRTIIAAGTLGAAAAGTTAAQAAPLLGLDAAGLGVRPDSPQDQTPAFGPLHVLAIAQDAGYRPPAAGLHLDRNQAHVDLHRRLKVRIPKPGQELPA